MEVGRGNRRFKETAQPVSRGGFPLSRKLLFSLGPLVLLALPWASAQAGWHIGIGIGGPVYCRPYYGYPVYVSPAPVYVVPPPGAVYVQPPAVYQAAPPVYQAPTPPTPPTPPTAYPNLPSQPVPVVPGR
jgi:hypothetical protein